MNLRQFIVDQSSLPAGNTVRDHIQNPAVGGGGSGYLPLPVYLQSIQVEDQSQTIMIEIPKTPEIRVIDYDNVIIITEEQLIGFQQ